MIQNMNTKVLLHCGEGSNLILGTGREKIFLTTQLIAAGVLRINIWFFIPVPKIKFDPPPQQKKNAKKYNFFQMSKFHQ